MTAEASPESAKSTDTALRQDEPHACEDAYRWQACSLARNDNVATLLEPVAAGQDIVVDVAGNSTTIRSVEPIALNHKIALTDLRSGDALIKYGECIGEATAAIARGAWVHTHNMRSRRARPDAPSVFDPYAYMDAVAGALGLSIPAASRDAVAANLDRLHALAREVTAFEVPQLTMPTGPDFLGGSADDGKRSVDRARE